MPYHPELFTTISPVIGLLCGPRISESRKRAVSTGSAAAAEPAVKSIVANAAARTAADLRRDSGLRMFLLGSTASRHRECHEDQRPHAQPCRATTARPTRGRDGERARMGLGSAERDG